MSDDKDYMELELEGAVYFVEKDKDGNVISKEELEPELVLQAVMYAIESGLHLMEDKDEPQDIG